MMVNTVTVFVTFSNETGYCLQETISLFTLLKIFQKNTFRCEIRQISLKTQFSKFKLDVYVSVFQVFSSPLVGKTQFLFT